VPNGYFFGWLSLAAPLGVPVIGFAFEERIAPFECVPLPDVAGPAFMPPVLMPPLADEPPVGVFVNAPLLLPGAAEPSAPWTLPGLLCANAAEDVANASTAIIKVFFM
jgi:hypothetical protein